MGGSTKVVDNSPKDVSGLRKNFINYLQTPPTTSPAQTGGQASGWAQGQWNNYPQPGPRPQTNPMGVSPQGPFGGVANAQAGMPGGMPRSDYLNAALGGGGNFGPASPQGAPSGTEYYGGIPAYMVPGGGGGQIPSDQMPPYMGGGTAGGGGSVPGGGGSGSPFDRMIAQLPPEIQRTVLGQMQQVGSLPQARTDYNSGMPQVGSNYDFQAAFDQFLPQLLRNRIQDVQGAGVAGQSTTSVDQLGGKNSAFFNNMMGQLSPAFDQRRAEAMAAAKQASGNLTGSGHANILGSAINRSLGDERASLADYATRGLESEVNRQTQLAGINTQAAIASADNATKAALANQGADVNFLQMLLQRGGMGLQGALANQGAAIQAGQLGQRGQEINAGNYIQALLAGQRGEEFNIGNELQRQQFNAGQQNTGYLTQAQLDAQRLQQMYQGALGTNQQNAQNYLQALLNSMGIKGEIVQSGGAGALLAPIASGLGYGLGNMLAPGIGGMIGGAAAGKIASGATRGI